MENKTAKLIGVAAAVATGTMMSAPAQAVAQPVPVAHSYADLLMPVPDAVSRLAADDAAAPAQVMGGDDAYRHHHHHHHHNRRWYRQHGYMWDGRAWVIRQMHHHHHHHHHHNHN